MIRLISFNGRKNNVADNSFILEILTSSDNDTFTIPTHNSSTYNYSVYLDDVLQGENNTNDTTITIPLSGTHQVKIKGVFPRIYFNDSGDKQKLKKILQWGVYGVGQKNHEKAFFGCSNLTEIANDVSYINSITNASWMFGYCRLGGLPEDLTLESLQHGTGMFFDNYDRIKDLPIGVKLPNLKDGAVMFYASEINTERYSQLYIDLSSLNTNNNVSFHGGSSMYNSHGEAAKTILQTPPRNWNFNDGGLDV